MALSGSAVDRVTKGRPATVIPRHVDCHMSAKTCRAFKLVELRRLHTHWQGTIFNNTMVHPFLRTFSFDLTNDFSHQYLISVRALQLPVPLARHPPAHLYLHVHPRGRTTAH